MSFVLRRFIHDVTRHKEILPLVGLVTGACVVAVGLLARTATINPDVVWDHKTNPHPWCQIRPEERVKVSTYQNHVVCIVMSLLKPTAFQCNPRQ